VTEDKAPARKAVDKKPDVKAVAIPTFSSSAMSRLDSAVARASTAGANRDLLAMPGGQIAVGSGRARFDEPEQNAAPQRAQVIGGLPTPKVPDQLADIEGDVRVQFTVDTDGQPVMSTFAVVASPNSLLTAVVRKAVSGMRFEPAKTGGKDSRPVSDLVQIAYKFARRPH
jgi:TonB family protein